MLMLLRNEVKVGGTAKRWPKGGAPQRYWSDPLDWVRRGNFIWGSGEGPRTENQISGPTQGNREFKCIGSAARE